MIKEYVKGKSLTYHKYSQQEDFNSDIILPAGKNVKQLLPGEGKVVALPAKDEIDVKADIHLVIEFYSKI